MLAYNPITIRDNLSAYFVCREVITDPDFTDWAARKYYQYIDSYDVSKVDSYTSRGVYSVDIISYDIDDAGPEWIDEGGLAICAIREQDNMGYDNGNTYTFKYDNKIVSIVILKYVRGYLHDGDSWARYELNYAGPMPYGVKHYYIGGKLVDRKALEVKQRAVIVELLPQPIWEEVLEHYAIEV